MTEAAIALRPIDVAEAVSMASAHPDHVLCTGGTGLMRAVNARVLRPAGWILLRHLTELGGCHVGDAGVVLGASTTIDQLAGMRATHPALADAADLLGTPQVRAVATVGGNVAMGLATSDLIPALMVHDAELVVATSDGERRVPLDPADLGTTGFGIGPSTVLTGLGLRGSGPGGYRRVALRGAAAVSQCGVALRADGPDVRLVVADGTSPARHLPEVEALVADGADAAQVHAAVHDLVEPAPPDGGPVTTPAAYRRHAVAVLAARLHRSVVGG